MEKTTDTNKKKLSKVFNKSKSLITRDSIKIQNQIKKLHKKTDSIDEEDVKIIEKFYLDAKKRIDARLNSIPIPKFDPSLPINTRKDEIINKIKENQVVIIAGETGSGKTTQIPKLCLEAGRGKKGDIACTQPRRIAAVSVSNRISEELNQNIGESVGYKIRFKEVSSKNTIIKIMTDGILLAETLSDRFLNAYDTIIVDEAHERSLNIDFLLGFLSNLIKKRRDLKLIITSATIDTEKFSKAFGNAPVIEVSGRMYPVETIYLPPQSIEEEDGDLPKLAADAADLIKDESNGDMLIFMPTESDITETIEKLKGKNYKKSTILPLYARLPSYLQQKVFKPVSGQKIVVATNVAETSLTIPGIKYVIDTGLARIPRYIPSSRTTSLLVGPVSKSSCDQRKGRCGRVSDGICIRLYSQENFNERPRFTLPEILRSNLSDVLLKMTALKLGNIKDFPFIDRPEPKHINDGYNLLTELGAIRETKKPGVYKLTKIGSQMSKIPLDPKLSRMLIEGASQGCLNEAAIIVSGLTAGDPREYPEDNKEKAVAAQRVFIDPLSDFITILNIWNRFNKESNNKLSTSATGKFSKKYFLSFRRLKEWKDLYSQILDILDEEGVKNLKNAAQTPPDKNSDTSPLYEAIHKSILSGYLSNIAMKTEKNFFKAAKNRDVMIFPGSGIFNKAKDFIVAAEIVETSRLFARTAGYVKPEWIKDIANDLCKETIYDPHYEKDLGRVVAYSQKALYGLILTSNEKVSFDKYNRDEAAQIFYSQALLTGEVKERLSFLNKNKEVEKSVKDMEDRLRKRDIFVSDQVIIEFYEKRIPQISDIRTLKSIIRKKGDKFLIMKKEDLMNYDPENEIKKQFPDFIELGNEKFKCRYNFSPGEKNDGVTISIPVNKTASITPTSIEPVVPGLFQDKIEAILKGLPKNYRTKLNPVREKAKIIADEIKKDERPLAIIISEFIKKRFNIGVPVKIITSSKVPDHLNMRLEITDLRGKVINISRDPMILKTIDVSDLTDNKKVKGFKSKYEKRDVEIFKTIPNIVKVYPDRKNSPIFYPGYTVTGDKIDLKLYENQRDADNHNRQGVLKFYEKLFSTQIKNLKKQAKFKTANQKLFALFEKKDVVEKGLLESVKHELLAKNFKDEEEFHSHAKEIKDKRALNFLIQEKQETILSTLEIYSEVLTYLNNLEVKYFKTKLISDIIRSCQKSVKGIIPTNFYMLYNLEEVQNLPRYLKAIKIRAERGISKPQKDYEKKQIVEKFEKRLGILLDDLDEHSSDEKRKETESFFWDIEELKVSIFAQELKTRYPVSQKKLETKFSKTAKMI